MAYDLGVSDQLEMGFRVANLFDAWPKNKRHQPHVDREKLLLQYPPHQLVLWKSTCEGSSVAMAASPFTAYWAEPELRQALLNILKKGRASKQLGLAKCKGASRTALLLDDHIDFDPGIVSKAISMVNKSLLSGIDEVYLLSDSGGAHVQQVWPEWNS